MYNFLESNESLEPIFFLRFSCMLKSLAELFVSDYTQSVSRKAFYYENTTKTKSNGLDIPTENMMKNIKYSFDADFRIWFQITYNLFAPYRDVRFRVQHLKAPSVRIDLITAVNMECTFFFQSFSFIFKSHTKLFGYDFLKSVSMNILSLKCTKIFVFFRKF